MLVYVINKDKKLLMPCTPVIARLLLKDKKAKVIRNCPFTIKLLQESDEYRQELTLGIDTGSSKIGSAVVDNIGNVVYMGEVEVRNDIAEKMKRRFIYRHDRRHRKTRYRKQRPINRKNDKRKGRLSPTVTSKINGHIKEINFIKNILSINFLVIETASFNTDVLKDNETINKYGFIKKDLVFSNIRSYVLFRDNHLCQYCLGKSKDKKLHVHHIIYKSNGGSNNEENLITLCKTCHKKLHDGLITIGKTGNKNYFSKNKTHMNIIRSQLIKKLNFIETFGYITKEVREYWNLPKKHYFDAVCIAVGNIPSLIFKNDSIIFKKCVSDGDYQLTRGTRGEQKIPTKKIHGFRKFDKIKYKNKEYFIKGRMSKLKGYAILMDIYGNTINIKPIPKMDKMKRISARKSWIITNKNVADIRKEENGVPT